MAAALATGKYTVEVLETFLFSNEKVFAEIEKQWIEQEDELKRRKLNVVHNKVIAEVRAEARALKSLKFNVNEDAKLKCYTISYRLEGKKMVERFYWGASKAEAHAKAKERQGVLRFGRVEPIQAEEMPVQAVKPVEPAVVQSSYDLKRLDAMMDDARRMRRP